MEDGRLTAHAVDTSSGAASDIDQRRNMPIDRRWLPEITERVKRAWRPQRRDFSAGGVAYRQRIPDGRKPTIEVALIATHAGRRWQLPKGTREADETALQTALREVAEEAGLLTEPVRFLSTVEYWYWDTYRKDVAHLVRKRVDFFLLRVVGGELSDASIEVDGVGWFTPEQALRTLTFSAERGVLRKAMGHFDALRTERSG
jgi:8-oxo-dGTP pyrophosphatase MutT (NUDIX family)